MNVAVKAHLRQNDVLGTGEALLSDAVHECLGGQAGGLGCCQPLCNAVHVNILVESLLHSTQYAGRPLLPSQA